MSWLLKQTMSSKIVQLSTQVSNNEDVAKLLDHVNWRIFNNSCKQICFNFSYCEYEFQDDCPNSTSFFSNFIGDLLFYSSRYGGRGSTTLVSNSVPPASGGVAPKSPKQLSHCGFLATRLKQGLYGLYIMVYLRKWSRGLKARGQGKRPISRWQTLSRTRTGIFEAKAKD